MSTTTKVLTDCALSECPSDHGNFVCIQTVDSWSAGLILHEMVSGKPLFEATSDNDLLAKIQKPIPVPSELSRKFKKLLTQLLEQDPQKRIDGVAFSDHQWLNPLQTMKGLYSV